jgi:hypothetical protein
MVWTKRALEDRKEETERATRATENLRPWVCQAILSLCTKEVTEVPGQRLRSRSCLSIYFLATLQLLLSFHHLHTLSTFATINCFFCARIRTASYSRAGQHLTVDTI